MSGCARIPHAIFSLCSKSAHKTRLLQESYEAHQLSSKVAELDKWLDRVEHDLGTEDHGVDVQSAEKLIKKHDQLRSEIDAKSPVIQEVVDKAAHLKSLVRSFLSSFC